MRDDLDADLLEIVLRFCEVPKGNNPLLDSLRDRLVRHGRAGMSPWNADGSASELSQLRAVADLMRDCTEDLCDLADRLSDIETQRRQKALHAQDDGK